MFSPTVKFEHDHPELIISTSGKGKVTTIMYREEYIEHITGILPQRLSTFG